MSHPFYSLGADEVCALPPHLWRFTAGSVLAGAIWEGVSALERHKEYALATLALLVLLNSPYTRHRRGRWWNRASLDLTHMKCEALALEVLFLRLKIRF